MMRQSRKGFHIQFLIGGATIRLCASHVYSTAFPSRTFLDASNISVSYSIGASAPDSKPVFASKRNLPKIGRLGTGFPDFSLCR